MCQINLYLTQVYLGSDLWVRMSLKDLFQTRSKIFHNDQVGKNAPGRVYDDDDDDDDNVMIPSERNLLVFSEAGLSLKEER